MARKEKALKDGHDQFPNKRFAASDGITNGLIPVEQVPAVRRAKLTWKATLDNRSRSRIDLCRRTFNNASIVVALLNKSLSVLTILSAPRTAVRSFRAIHCSSIQLCGRK